MPPRGGGLGEGLVVEADVLVVAVGFGSGGPRFSWGHDGEHDDLRPVLREGVEQLGEVGVEGGEARLPAQDSLTP